VTLHHAVTSGPHPVIMIILRGGELRGGRSVDVRVATAEGMQSHLSLGHVGGIGNMPFVAGMYLSISLRSTQFPLHLFFDVSHGHPRQLPLFGSTTVNGGGGGGGEPRCWISKISCIFSSSFSCRMARPRHVFFGGQRSRTLKRKSLPILATQKEKRTDEQKRQSASTQFSGKLPSGWIRARLLLCAARPVLQHVPFCSTFAASNTHRNSCCTSCSPQRHEAEMATPSFYRKERSRSLKGIGRSTTRLAASS